MHERANPTLVKRDGKMKRSSDDECANVEALVIAVIPEYHQTVTRAPDGRQYTVTDRATGVPWRALKEGQRVRCLVAKSRGIVLNVEVLD